MNNKNYGKLAEKLNEADIERRKIQEEADRRERAAEIRREERLAKIQYMNDMPDSQPAGTGKILWWESLSFSIYRYSRTIIIHASSVIIFAV